MVDRIALFIDQAVSLQDHPRKAAQLCKAEIRTLYADYADSTVHYWLTKYRNAIRAAKLETPYLTLMREPVRKVQASRKRFQSDLYKRQAHQHPIYDADAIVNQAVALLDKESYAAVSLGIALLTGRRIYEVCVTGSFMIVRGQAHHVRFSGQAKTRDAKKANKPYLIPVLIEPKRLVDAVAYLRSLRDFTAYLPANDADATPRSRAFHDRTAKTLREMCTKHFDQLVEDCTPHDLRKIYAVIAYDWFAPVDMSVGRYVSEILGHNEGDLATVQSYQDFYLATHTSV